MTMKTPAHAPPPTSFCFTDPWIPTRVWSSGNLAMSILFICFPSLLPRRLDKLDPRLKAAPSMSPEADRFSRAKAGFLSRPKN
jgi:hypothetical protein